MLDKENVKKNSWTLSHLGFHIYSVVTFWELNCALLVSHSMHPSTDALSVTYAQHFDSVVAFLLNYAGLHE